MNKLLIKLIPGVLLFCLTGGAAMAQTRIATVDLSRVFTNYWKFKQADAALQDMKLEMAKSDKEMVDTYQKAKESYDRLLVDANNQVLSAEQRDKNKKAAEDKLKEMRDTEDNVKQFRQQAGIRLNDQTLRMRDNLLSEIRAAVNSKAKAGGYTLLFDSAALTGDRTPVILFSSSEDLTDAVLAQLNAGAPVENASAEEKKSGGKK